MIGLENQPGSSSIAKRLLFMCTYWHLFHFVLLHGENKFISYRHCKKDIYLIIFFFTAYCKNRYSWSHSLKDWLKVAAALLLYLNSKSVFKFQDFYCLCHFQVKLHAKNGSLFDYCYHYWIKYAPFSQKKDALKYIYIKMNLSHQCTSFY